MTPRFKQQLIRYWLAANEAAIEGGAVAVKTFLTLAGANAAGVAVPTLNLQQAAYVFLGGAAYHFLDYLTSHPLPLPLDVPVIAAAVVPETQNPPPPGSGAAGQNQKIQT